MPENQISQQVPQFGTLETSTPGGAICKVCQTPLAQTYYRAGNNMVCGRCADRIRREMPQDSHAAFVRAILCGLVGFAIGLVIYAAFAIATGITIGYLALAVGFIVGKAMMIGSRGVGGRRFQIAAVLLTYAAVSMASVPIAIHSMKAHQRSTAQSQVTATDSSSPTQDNSAGEASQENGSNANATSPKKVTMGGAIGTLTMIGLASPFLELTEGASGLIGLVILFVGMRFAWKMTAGRGNVKVEGPFQLADAASA
jgi:predicted lipid-binding transport protein (Tim44 family)